MNILVRFVRRKLSTFLSTLEECILVGKSEAVVYLPTCSFSPVLSLASMIHILALCDNAL